MSLDSKKALTVFFSSKNWQYKLLLWVLAFVLADICVYLITTQPKVYWFLWFVTFAIGIFLGGYINLSGHNELNNKEELLPSFEWLNMLKAGVLAGVTRLALSIPSLLILIIAATSAYITKFSPISIFLIIVAIIFALANTLFISFSTLSFLKDLQFSEGFNFTKNWELLKYGWSDMILAYLWEIVLTIFVCIIAFIVNLPVAIPLILLFKTVGIKKSQYFSNIGMLAGGLVGVNIEAQVYKNVCAKLAKKLTPEIDEQTEQ